MNNPKSEPDLEQQTYLYTTAIPIVSNNVPDIPSMNIKGKKTATRISVVAIIAKVICFEPL